MLWQTVPSPPLDTNDFILFYFGGVGLENDGLYKFTLSAHERWWVLYYNKQSPPASLTGYRQSLAGPSAQPFLYIQWLYSCIYHILFSILALCAKFEVNWLRNVPTVFLSIPPADNPWLIAPWTNSWWFSAFQKKKKKKKKEKNPLTVRYHLPGSLAVLTEIWGHSRQPCIKHTHISRRAYSITFPHNALPLSHWSMLDPIPQWITQQATHD